jgi:hypothetical protein
MKQETVGWVSIVLLLFLVCDPLHFFSGWVRLVFILFSSWAVPYFYLMWRGDKASDEHVWFPEETASTGQYLMTLSQYGEGDELPQERVYLHSDIIELHRHLHRKRREAEKKGEEEQAKAQRRK